MNREYENCIRGNILTQSFFCRLTACLIIMFIAHGCAAKPAIIKAAGSGDISTIKRLQAEGQNINEKDSRGATALMSAIWSKKPAVAKYLIESGADVKAKYNDGSGSDALIYAVSYGQLELINILLDKGADIESRDYQGDTPLVYAALHTINIDAVRILIKRGANVNTENNASRPLLGQLQDILTNDLLSNKSLYIGRGIFDTAALPHPIAIVAELVNAGANLFEPKKGMARLIFIGEDFFLHNQHWVNLGGALNKDYRFNFIDVKPGNHEVAIRRYLSLSIKLDIDAKAGQTYYIMTSKDKTGLIEESVGKAKIKELLKPINWEK